MLELSTLAEASAQVALEMVFDNIRAEQGASDMIDALQDHFCVVALGKLGGYELNYSSDIDLLGFWEWRSVWAWQ